MLILTRFALPKLFIKKLHVFYSFLSTAKVGRKIDIHRLGIIFYQYFM